MVGDTPADIISGRRAGASLCAGVLTGSGSEDELRVAGADFLLSSIVDLPKLLLQ